MIRRSPLGVRLCRALPDWPVGLAWLAWLAIWLLVIISVSAPPIAGRAAGGGVGVGSGLRCGEPGGGV
jgi:hypothetical protein